MLAASRLISTLGVGDSRAPGIDTSVDAARMSACATKNARLLHDDFVDGLVVEFVAHADRDHLLAG